MRYFFTLLLLSSCSIIFAQKMLESHEWCAKKHMILPESLLNTQDGRSDSIDIIRVSVTLDLLNVPQVKAAAALHIQSKVNGLSGIRLDLEGLTVDSVVTNSGEALTFTYNSPALTLNFPDALDASVPLTFTVYYRGVPPTDASGWGGYYNTGGYTFNLGVGFAADPHSYGRAWFPCFDNFVERFAFELTTRTPSNRKSYGNGYMTNEVESNGILERSWRIDESIPSYLACFAVGPYVSFERQLTGEGNTTVPVEIACVAADTNKVKSTFQRLQQALDAYEYWFGPYQWNKIGYSLVPFNSGAMEHATNVAIGRAYIDGTSTFETLWAHELTHMWWGDLATCSTAEDMWLNEGWASYGEHLFLEKAYGKEQYLNTVVSNHLNVLQNAHVNEGGYRAVSGLPHSLTYGTHVYNKGASVAHNLRGYMGDSLFRIGCREALENNRFADWSSAGLRDKMEAATGVDLDDFFNDWVFAGGYPDYTVDSVEVLLSPVDAPTLARVHVKQKLRGAPHFHQNVPLEFTFMLSDGSQVSHSGKVSGEESVLDFYFNAWGPQPMNVFVNTNSRLLQARAQGQQVIKSTGAANYAQAKFHLTVNNLGADSVFFRVEHHFVAPDNAGANPNGYALTNRYWSVYSDRKDFPAGFDAQAILIYDGKGQADQLDRELFASTSPSEDSIILLYRPGAGHAWQEWPTYTKITLGSANDRFGQLRPTGLKTGEYTIGKGVSTVGVRNPEPLGKIKVFPNVTRAQQVTVQTELSVDYIQLINAEGIIVRNWNFASATEMQLDIQDLPAGNYWLLIQGEAGQAVSKIQKY
ncbi:MAG: T9SS type A sorting domain-containing protein [Saprospiraceae bacterium]|nr:T9SS type A sorting domain-containing protein [Saprospiraceae bacterium]